jgi:hypothetical protein
MNELDEIKNLLNAYYEGKTNTAEEKRLYKFFSQTDVPQELSADKKLFLSLSSLQETPEIPSGLESRIASCIDGWEQEEQVRTERHKKMTHRILLRRCAGIAAGLFLVFSVGTYLYHHSQLRPLSEDTCASPEEAYAEAQKALLLFSHSLNKGLAQMEKAEEATVKVKKVVEKHVNNFNNQEK